MKWWCKYCGCVSESRPEDYRPQDYGAPSRVCWRCQEMIDAGEIRNK